MTFAIFSRTGIRIISPGPLTPENLPRRKITARSYSLSTRMEFASKTTARSTSTPKDGNILTSKVCLCIILHSISKICHTRKEKNSMGIKSMTGYGKGISVSESCDVKVEIKSVNSKYLDLNIRMPKYLSFIEISIKNIIRERLERGKVDMFVDVNLKKSQYKPKLNRELLEGYINTLTAAKEEFSLDGSISLDHVISLPDVIGTEEDNTLGDTVGKVLIDALNTALDGLESMRAEEGQALKADLLERIAVLEEMNREIDENRKDVYNFWYDKYTARVKELLPEGFSDERIIQEAALYAERSDITEEVTRIYAHGEHMRQIINSKTACGKKLDFLCQEFNREFNTIGSKSSKIGIINNVVRAKSELDRIREQVQNIV
ncbi:MAG TPA: YicC family protein [Deferribacteraceae bacterium]|nr:YicC family protein [Deferribacteraceae bacterium]